MIKKTILMLLVLVGGVIQANAWNYLVGFDKNWNDQTAYCLDKGPVAVYFAAGDYEFKIHGDHWYGANNNANITETTTISNFSTDTQGNNFNLKVTKAGYYVFNLKWDNGMSLKVSYPNTTIYFYNAFNWSSVYLHDGWWNGDNGACNMNALRGVEMTAGENNIYYAYIPKESLTRVTFTSDKQVNDDSGDTKNAGYNNFFETNVVWNAAEFDASTPLYIPTGDAVTLNNSSYYYGGSFHAYPTYTRTVTSGNLGTICLPFAATVTGAKVYKITGTKFESGVLKGIYVEPVENLVAGNAYIFQAESATLTATFSGNPTTTANEADGMLGNLSSVSVNVTAGNYIIKDNKIRKVAAGTVTIGQYKAYITLNNVGESTSPYFIGADDATGIEGLEIENTNDAIYNLQGQRVTNIEKGVYIINGKKVLVK